MASRHDIRALTGIRGIAALWVVIYHVNILAVLPAPLGSLLVHGYLAVDVFFVLSGFVMAMSYAAYFRDGFTLDRYAIFLIRRMARVYPLYIASVFGIALLCGLHKSQVWYFNGPDLIANILLVSAWGFGRDINLPAWSISAEFAAYLLFPWLVGLAMARKMAGPVAMTILSIAALVWIAWLPTKLLEDRNGVLDVTWQWTFYPVIRCLAGFMLGLVAYRAALSATVKRLVKNPAVALAVATLLLALASVPNSDLMFVALLPIFIICLAEGSGLVLRFLASPIVYFLGEISYAMYLVHAHIFRIREGAEPLLAKVIPPGPAFYLSYGVYYAVLFVVSYVLFRFFETPMRKLLRRLENIVLPASENDVATSESAGIAAVAPASGTRPAS